MTTLERLQKVKAQMHELWIETGVEDIGNLWRKLHMVEESLVVDGSDEKSKELIIQIEQSLPALRKSFEHVIGKE